MFTLLINDDWSIILIIVNKTNVLSFSCSLKGEHDRNTGKYCSLVAGH